MFFEAATNLRGVKSFSAVAIAALLLPTAAVAQVVISEIMYDLPVGSDSGREWIEVFNSGSTAVTLTEWKMFEGGVNHSISPYTGSETLGSGTYAVISDNPAKFLEDWPTYSGPLFDSAFSLSNTGEALALRCCGSDLVDKDSIMYSSGIGASGDGNSLRRMSASDASLTALSPTPGMGSLVAQQGSSDSSSASTTQTGSQTQQTQTSSSSNTASASGSSYVPPPESEVFVDVGENRTVIVAADVEFNARAYNRKKETVDHVRFLWNFGDGSTAEGPAVVHHFEYPGRYAVIVNIAEDKTAASDQIIITAEPARLAFSVLPDGGVAIENRAGRDLDLSRWIIRSFGRDFFLPEHSVVLAGATARISQKTLGFSSSLQTELDYPNGVVALRAGEVVGDPETSMSAQPQVSVVPVSPEESTPTVQTEAQSVAEDPSDPTSSSISTEEATSVAQMAASASTFSGSSVWWLGALALAGAAGAALFVARRFGKGEWDIVEESPN